MLTGARSPRWQFWLLNREDQRVRLLDGVTGGSGEVSAQARLGGSAQLTIDEVGQGIDFQFHRVQAVYDPGVPGESPWPMGTYLLTSPEEQHTPFGVSYRVGLLTKMTVIDEDAVEATFSVSDTQVVTTVVKQLIESTGETRHSITESDKTLSSALTWEAGTSKLTIINELLTAIGYWSLWCDFSGVFRVEPYVNPADRPVAFEFEHGEASVHLPDWSRTQDQSKVPNRFVTVGQGDEETEPLVGVAVNENPDSPYSYQARGRWITATETGVEGDSQEVFDQLAERRLRDAMSPVAHITAAHALLRLQPNDLVSFRPEDGRRRLATVQSMKWNYVFDTDCAAEWREVVPI